MKQDIVREIKDLKLSIKKERVRPLDLYLFDMLEKAKTEREIERFTAYREMLQELLDTNRG